MRRVTGGDCEERDGRRLSGETRGYFRRVVQPTVVSSYLDEVTLLYIQLEHDEWRSVTLLVLIGEVFLQ